MKWIVVGITVLAVSLIPGISNFPQPTKKPSLGGGWWRPRWPALGDAARSLVFEDCGAYFDVQSIRISSCSTTPCTLFRGMTSTVTVEFRTNGSPPATALRHEAYFILNAIRTRATITPNVCDGTQCPLQSDQGLLFEAVIQVSHLLPALRGNLRWELKDEWNEVLLCYQVPILITS
ncbi:NPC intracellular cholesterol transporter 2-like [Uranotaenia lowii]|uniref:NPC intracellular cholesterol transporter 2-like n=1 Tax=Uranotaenia lowii TaxID=190385 RepID=UPI00247A644D|nr:NPC intracellular cholesterol transporter 2-like [Uranotaenia lowii]XP_055609758.1 NPC intracellular cholesterol transporter 2-like [Uranotaenia lowii]